MRLTAIRPRTPGPSRKLAVVGLFRSRAFPPALSLFTSVVCSLTEQRCQWPHSTHLPSDAVTRPSVWRDLLSVSYPAPFIVRICRGAQLESASSNDRPSAFRWSRRDRYE